MPSQYLNSAYFCQLFSNFSSSYLDGFSSMSQYGKGQALNSHAKAAVQSIADDGRYVNIELSLDGSNVKIVPKNLFTLLLINNVNVNSQDVKNVYQYDTNDGKFLCFTDCVPMFRSVNSEFANLNDAADFIVTLTDLGL